MKKRFFASLTKSRIEYAPFTKKLLEPVSMPIPSKVTLLLKDSLDQKEPVLVKKGAGVKTGQKLVLFESTETYVISSATGTVSSISSHTGNFGWSGTVISIDVSEKEEHDGQFKSLCEKPTLETAINFLVGVPGSPPFSAFSNPEKPIHTILISAVDQDLLVATNQLVLQTQMEALIKGIHILKRITGIENVILVVPINIMSGYGHIDAKIKAASPAYPSGLPQMIMKDVMGQVLPAGKCCEDLGIAFFNAEAVASIGRAFEEGRIPVAKLITLINKDGDRAMLSVRIGTPVDQIFKAFNITLNDRDRIIFGGPMMGISIYSKDHPVESNTDAIMVQDKDTLPYISDYPCINCGECIRICPVKIPVNMLVRFLEAGHYQEAADLYDLYCCIDCGLCSFVCVSRIPILQYIKLAKYEFGRTQPVEEANA